VDVREVVEASFAQPQKCYGHCEQPAIMRFLNAGEPAVACYTCPAGYVSRVIAYGKADTRDALRAFMTKALGGQHIKDEDIRTASRYPWDLGLPGFEMKAAYWTQNYRASKSDDPDRQALFVCSECGSPYVKPVAAPGTKCANCRG
jgi:hypothetical protein